MSCVGGIGGPPGEAQVLVQECDSAMTLRARKRTVRCHSIFSVPDRRPVQRARTRPCKSKIYATPPKFGVRSPPCSSSKAMARRVHTRSECVIEQDARGDAPFEGRPCGEGEPLNVAQASPAR